MFSHSDLQSVSLPLPEDVLKKKYAGDIEGALRAVRYRLAQPGLPECMAQRLRAEEGILTELPFAYPYTEEEALALLQRAVPDFTAEELSAFEEEGKIDFQWIDGKKRYLRSFVASLFHSCDDLARRAGRPHDASNADRLRRVIAEVRENGVCKRRIRMKASLKIKDEFFVPGETYLVHIPIPIEEAEIRYVRLLSFSHAPKSISSNSAPQRTVAFEEVLAENAPFFVEYEYDVIIRRAQGYDAPPPNADDLSEHAPHILFTPYMRSLERELSKGLTDPEAKARAYYDFITTRTTYSYVRDYFLIDDAGEYVAKNRKGDCGLQALCFITLCRIGGIPARWQSGLYVHDEDAGCHDWAMFFTKDRLWRFCDPSFGGSAYRQGDEVRRDFYFGNLDPFRMAANRAYYVPFAPEKCFPRNDPYDNQSGECESTVKAYPERELETKCVVLSME
ncbi:MAG: transglutaminase-like domain-containing protein [Christensenellales bacterium]|jgi:transglutaminase-like putative cysteine protease